jgi:hypothetical protein
MITPAKKRERCVTYTFRQPKHTSSHYTFYVTLKKDAARSSESQHVSMKFKRNDILKIKKRKYVLLPCSYKTSPQIQLLSGHVNTGSNFERRDGRTIWGQETEASIGKLWITSGYGFFYCDKSTHECLHIP